MKTSILIHLATGFEETEAVTIIDVLRRAFLDVTVISVTGSLKVTGAHNITIEADQLYDEANYETATMIILPGGMPGTSNLLNHTGLRGQLKKFHEEKKFIGAICAAPMILGSMGFLQNRKAVCYPGFESKLTGATVLYTPFAVDEHIITGRGVGTALDFSLEIVKLLKGEHPASELRTALVIP
ncbi:MAG: DJ-1/PfpI family protein [Prolixibacteraceae bacterium]|jgi:4-methyl-5(b-hydroxyethyl)-thiazole monophosphate biosynthesis|nr:DJ-1/PfpI family protein [Prolixibacteraceae bacterium]